MNSWVLFTQVTAPRGTFPRSRTTSPGRATTGYTQTTPLRAEGVPSAAWSRRLTRDAGGSKKKREKGKFPGGQTLTDLVGKNSRSSTISLSIPDDHMITIWTMLRKGRTGKVQFMCAASAGLRERLPKMVEGLTWL